MAEAIIILSKRSGSFYALTNFINSLLMQFKRLKNNGNQIF